LLAITAHENSEDAWADTLDALAMLHPSEDESRVRLQCPQPMPDIVGEDRLCPMPRVRKPWLDFIAG